jgi:DNA helicase IV
MSDEIGREQGYVSMLYDRLDGMREQAADRLAEVLRETGGTPQQRSQRDAEAGRYTDQLTRLNAVEQGLCFGRLDYQDDGVPLGDGDRLYIGRIGVFDEDGDYEPLLVDWRAPAARAFYLATAASPIGIARRRHIRSSGRKVVGLDDEILDLTIAGAGAAQDSGAYQGLVGEAALLSALSAGRTGRMKDIVETIQAEQDRIIRSSLAGVLVVQGGPGTGKTAVALHRAAYLLYTHRDQLASRGVLIVGPNETFLRYISQVLPSLAETGVLLCTPGELFPGVRARRPEPPQAAEVKGRLVMTDVIANAVRDRQQIPDFYRDIELGEGETLILAPETVERARASARRCGKLHNQARDVFATELVHALAEQVGDRIGFDPFAHDPLGGNDAPGVENVLDDADMAEIRRELAGNPSVHAILDELWPILTPQRLLLDLFTAPDRLESAAPQLTDDERTLLLRPAGVRGWTVADVPLLDEAAELLGDTPEVPAAQTLADRRRQEQMQYAEGALDILIGSRSIDLEDEEDPELLLATDLLDAGELGERQDDEVRWSTAQRAAADRKWAFGHVIVDEAQELSPMAWRLLMRRCPSRSMTAVGDIAQTGDLAGASAWAQVFEPYVAYRWRQEHLTVNYRTPAEIMALAAEVLAQIDPALQPPRSVRHTGVQPWRVTVAGAVGTAVADLVVKESAALGEGRLAVITPVGLAGDVGRAVADAVPEAAMGERPELEARVVVLTVRQAKGLEFDSVIVVDPDRIVAESSRGRSDLYVAMTRPTQRLGIVAV